MMDKSLPLTTEEFEEWGNPAIEEFYHYIKSYSPMDNIGRHEYPDVLITSGFHDCRVRYFEVAKYAGRQQHFFRCSFGSSVLLPFHVDVINALKVVPCTVTINFVLVSNIQHESSQRHKYLNSIPPTVLSVVPGDEFRLHGPNMPYCNSLLSCIMWLHAILYCPLVYVSLTLFLWQFHTSSAIYNNSMPSWILQEVVQCGPMELCHQWSCLRIWQTTTFVLQFKKHLTPGIKFGVPAKEHTVLCPTSVLSYSCTRSSFQNDCYSS